LNLEDKYPQIKNLIGQSENFGLFNAVKSFDNELDKTFGISYIEESAITDISEQAYKDIEKQALLTSYLDYHQVFQDIGQGQSIIDLGAGYCRGAFLANSFDYDINYIGIEYQQGRAKQAKQIFDKDILVEDILKFKVPYCENYFIYLPWNEVFFKFIYDLNSYAKETIFYIIESHGDFIESLDFYKDMFIREVDDLKTSIPRHDNTIYKYRFKPINPNKFLEKMYLPFLYSYKDTKIEVKSKVGTSNDYYIWSSSTLGMRLNYYNNRPCLFLEQSSRYLDFNSDEVVSIGNR
jgi:hypothetical protein